MVKNEKKHNGPAEVLSRATRSSFLDERIAANQAGQQIDLCTWIFERMTLGAGDHVLELCCGTGGQSLELSQRVGPGGHLVGMDKSADSLAALKEKLAASGNESATLLEGNLDDVGAVLRGAGLTAPAFDHFFCAYGLYYSKDAGAVLDEGLAWLRPGGTVVVVGPFGPNNGPLFRLLASCGVDISPYVLHTSRDFMTAEVLPWGAEHFERMQVHSMVNTVRWDAPERVIGYWQNSTFYDERKLPAVQHALDAAFKAQGCFVNEKWVMMVEMSHVR